MTKLNFLKKSYLLALALFAVALFSSFFLLNREVSGQAANTCLNNVCRLAPSSDMIISAHGESWLVRNIDTSRDIFIPTQSATEWAQFRTHYPAHIIIEVPYVDCSLPWGGTLAHGESVVAYSPSLTSYGCCQPTTRTCNDGTLEGDSSYNQASCSGDIMTFNYNGSPWEFSCIEKDGLVWMDRNLGATQVATASNDHLGYGDLFQWGRAADGHQLINWTSSTAGTPVNGSTSTLSSSDTPGDSLFITSSATPWDWRSPQNNNLWQGEMGINNPCPSGWRVPTEAELDAERQSWGSNNSAGAYASTLKWPVAGLRIHSSASLSNMGSYGYVWSSSVSSTSARYLDFSSGYAVSYSSLRAYGFSLRCLRDFSHFGLNYSSTAGGSVSGETSQVVAVGASGTAVEATADEGYVFVQWSDGSTQNPRTDSNVNSDIDVVAEFDIAPFVCGDSVTFTYNGSSETYGTVSRGGKCWLDRNLGADRVATASNDHLGYGDLFQWGRAADGHQLINWTSATAGTPVNGSTSTLSSSDTPGDSLFITSITSPWDWRSPQNNNLWQGEMGINNPCPSGWRVPTEAELDAERQSWGSNNSAGAYASTLKWPMAGFRHRSRASLRNMGSIGYVWSSSVSSTYARNLYFHSSSAVSTSYYRAYGFSLRCLRDFSHFGLNYSSTAGGSVSGETSQVVAVGASGTAVEATADEGYVFVQWSDGSTQNPRTDSNVNSDIDVVAEFDIAPFVCGDSVTFTYNGSSETYGTVSRGGKCWLDRNLGADRVATASNDHLGYGDLFQWGRAADGHQLINWTSATAGTPVNGSTSTLSSSDTPGDSLFITSITSPWDWRSPQNNNLWQGEMGINNPCPSGWRVPTEAELDAERQSWGSNNSAGAYASTLKWPMAGTRHHSSASLYAMGSYGLVWSSSVSSTHARRLYFLSSIAGSNSYYRAIGFSLRCLRD